MTPVLFVFMMQFFFSMAFNAFTICVSFSTFTIAISFGMLPASIICGISCAGSGCVSLTRNFPLLVVFKLCPPFPFSLLQPSDVSSEPFPCLAKCIFSAGGVGCRPLSCTSFVLCFHGAAVSLASLSSLPFYHFVFRQCEVYWFLYVQGL